MSKFAPVIKIGHYSKRNPWSRIAHRGFYSCLHPQELRGKVGVNDFDLLCWFPNLRPRDEKRLHNYLVDYRIIGEWFELEALSYLPECVPDENMYNDCNKLDALKTRKRL